MNVHESAYINIHVYLYKLIPRNCDTAKLPSYFIQMRRHTRSVRRHLVSHTKDIVNVFEDELWSGSGPTPGQRLSPAVTITGYRPSVCLLQISFILLLLTACLSIFWPYTHPHSFAGPQRVGPPSICPSYCGRSGVGFGTTSYIPAHRHLVSTSFSMQITLLCV